MTKTIISLITFVVYALTSQFAFADSYGDRRSHRGPPVYYGHPPGVQHARPHHRPMPPPPNYQGRPPAYHHGRPNYRPAPPLPPRYSNHHDRRSYKQHFRPGRVMPVGYRGHQYRVDDWRHHRLSEPPRGHHWYRVGRDFLLVAAATGVILSVLDY